MTDNIGDRVGVILGSNDKTKTLEFLGYGVYEGDSFPEEAVGFFAEIKRRLVEDGRLKKEDATNPRIRLDNGKVVYGCECWWGSEERVRNELEKAKRTGYKVVDVDIDKVREDYRKNDK